MAHELTHVVQQKTFKSIQKSHQQPYPQSHECVIVKTAPILTSDKAFQFIVNTDRLDTGEEERLRRKIRGTNAEQRINVLGMASEDGSAVLNAELSCKRAQKVAGIINEMGRTLNLVQATGGISGTQHQNEFRVVQISIGNIPPQSPPHTPTANSIPTSAPTPASKLSISDCNASQLPMVNTAVQNARTWISNVAPRLATFNAGKSPVSDQKIITDALIANFHTTNASDVLKIIINIFILRSRLNEDLDVDCTPIHWYNGCDTNVLAIVYGSSSLGLTGDVNLCPRFFTCGNAYVRYSTIIHEVSHKEPGTSDKGYEDTPDYATLSTEDAIDNADSYEAFIRQVYFNGSHGPGEKC